MYSSSDFFQNKCITYLHTSVWYCSQLVPRKCWTAFPATYCHLVTFILLTSISASTSTTSTTSLTDKLKSLFPSRHCEHNDKYQEKPDSLPLEVVKMWSHNRDRERDTDVCICYTGREPCHSVRIIGSQELTFLLSVPGCIS